MFTKDEYGFVLGVDTIDNQKTLDENLT